jgi:hypothetical protein
MSRSHLGGVRGGGSAPGLGLAERTHRRARTRLAHRRRHRGIPPTTARARRRPADASTSRHGRVHADTEAQRLPDLPPRALHRCKAQTNPPPPTPSQPDRRLRGALTPPPAYGLYDDCG